jgi:hypothetical protein
MGKLRLGLLASLGLGVASSVAVLASEDGSAPVSTSANGPPELQLVRVEYDSEGGAQEAYYFAYGQLWQRWETDFPAADRNLARRLTELTRVRVASEPLRLRLSDPDLLNHPLVYMSDVGWMQLSDEEQAGLRRYVENGGFVWVDDFWGDGEWGNFERVMRQVLPGVAWRELPKDHPVLQLVFDVPEVPQIPARDFAMEGYTTEPPDFHRDPAGDMEGAHLRGWFDADGRLMVLATHNTDMGDGFEREAYGQWYFETYSTRAYALAANIIVYALTH